jgi:hypothetical protein
VKDAEKSIDEEDEFLESCMSRLDVLMNTEQLKKNDVILNEMAFEVETLIQETFEKNCYGNSYERDPFRLKMIETWMEQVFFNTKFCTEKTSLQSLKKLWKKWIMWLYTQVLEMVPSSVSHSRSMNAMELTCEIVQGIIYLAIPNEQNEDTKKQVLENISLRMKKSALSILKMHFFNN